MAKWKRGGGRRRSRALSVYFYVDDAPTPLGLLPSRPPANMDAAGAGAVLHAQEDKSGCAPEEGVTQDTDVEETTVPAA